MDKIKIRLTHHSLVELGLWLTLAIVHRKINHHAIEQNGHAKNNNDPNNMDVGISVNMCKNTCK